MTEGPEAPMDASERKKVYRKTLNLPRTPFPMRANLAQNEPRSRKRWAEEGILRRLLDARAASEAFIFHDGPPYANGSIHVGHLHNKVLKDLVVRSQGMMGRKCHYVPGWDCHGLPIEHRVMTELVASGKMERLSELPVNTRRMAIRRECHRYASKYKKIQAEQHQRLLTLADYDDPYLTMAPAYEEGVLEVFASLVEAGLVYRDLKPVHWSIANRTALAEAELEYFEREDPSIYVHFDAADPAAVSAAFGVDSGAPISFLIWTTTPWTLPANRLIAVHPELIYALVRLGGEGRRTVIAAELVDTVAALAGIEPEVLATVRGEVLVDLTYRHPFLDGGGRLVTADYVTLDDGTGLVHTAPGHGQDDYLTGVRAGEPVYSPVRGDGTFDDSVPGWLRGQSVWDANPEIVERLRSSGHLVHALDYRHSYPHDWRSKTPVIFRCTEQWFIAVDRPAPAGEDARPRSLRERALDAAGHEIRFIPEWGRNRLRGMLESRPDWCISRQRSWGLPIPAFRTPSGEVLLTPASVRAVAGAFGREGSDAWFTREPAELLADYDPSSDPGAPAGVDVASLEKMYDIFDVWFESGSSWHAVLRRRGIGFPANLYLEGSDQHRGWFQLSLLPSLGVTGRSPFRELLTHGFMVDKEGKKMSKSLGNTLEVEDLLAQFGAEVCRWWVSSLAFENDSKADLSYLENAADSYRKVRNTLRFLLGNLSDFDPRADGVSDLAPASIDAWALARTAELRAEVLAAYGAYEFRRAHLLLFKFCNETLSALYLDAVKDRLYCDRPGAPRRRATQTVFHRIAEVLCGLLAPILPHTADEAWHALRGEEAESIHLQTVAGVAAVTEDPRWPKVLEVRDEVLRALEGAKADGLENPLDAGLVLPDPDGELAGLAAELPSVMGVSRVELDAAASKVTVVDLRDEPRCERSWLRDGTVRERADGGWLSERDARAVGLA